MDRAPSQMPARTGREIEQAADWLLQTWNDPVRPITNLPEAVRPENLAQAYGIQQAVSQRLGAIGGWVVWDSRPINNWVCAPLPLSSIHLGRLRLPAARWKDRRLVPWLCARLGNCLPNYDAPYSRERIMAAIESCHAGVEVRRPRIGAADATDSLTALADSNGYGCLAYDQHGLPLNSAASAHIQIRTIIGGTEMHAESAETGLDIIDAVHWLANDAAQWAGGLSVGQIIAVPIGTGELQVPPATPVRIIIGDLGSVDIQFENDGTPAQLRGRHIRNIWRGWRGVFESKARGSAPGPRQG